MKSIRYHPAQAIKSSWSISPNIPDNSTITFLQGIAARSATDIWAVGESNDVNGTPRTWPCTSTASSGRLRPPLSFHPRVSKRSQALLPLAPMMCGQ